MKPGLTSGQRAHLNWIVDATMVITLGGDSRATVFSTPNMILLMERAAREALRPWLEDGEESVGIDVNIQHLSGAGMGSSVTGVAVVTGIDGRNIQFDVEAWTSDRLLGRGTHRRAVVPVSRLIENLEKFSGQKSLSNMKTNIGSLPSFQTLRVEIQDRIGTVTLNRPASLNAVNMAMTSDIEQLVGWLLGHPEDVRVVLLTGAGRAFCAGDDVKELRSLDEPTARDLSLRQAAMYLAFEQLPQPVIAVINGDTFGGGCIAALAADLRIACHSARFGMPEIHLGWPPGYGIAQLSALIGKSRALEMCLMGDPISADTALQWGLINELVPEGMLIRRARQLASRMLQMPAEALRLTKRLVHLDEGIQPKVAHRADTEAYIRCLLMPDAREGLAAFAEKRSPKFSGR
ncbi:MAG: enoyl-CoA hydratase-related protein [Planctomycetaceae bacterium]